MNLAACCDLRHTISFGDFAKAQNKRIIIRPIRSGRRPSYGRLLSIETMSFVQC